MFKRIPKCTLWQLLIWALVVKFNQLIKQFEGTYRYPPSLRCAPVDADKIKVRHVVVS